MIDFSFAGKGVVLRLVEGDLEGLGALVIALQHADLRDVGKAEDAVGGGVVELGAVEQAAVHRRTISPPGSALTAAPIAVKRSIARPLVRNLRPLKSSALVIGFLNQPSGCVAIGP
jgi:hypothetical protein